MIEAHTKKAPEQAAEPHPPGRAHDRTELGHGAAQDRGRREEDYGPDEERERRCQHGATDDLAQLAVDGELRGRGHPCGERHGQQKSQVILFTLLSPLVAAWAQRGS